MKGRTDKGKGRLGKQCLPPQTPRHYVGFSLVVSARLVGACGEGAEHDGYIISVDGLRHGWAMLVDNAADETVHIIGRTAIGTAAPSAQKREVIRFECEDGRAVGCRGTLTVTRDLETTVTLPNSTKDCLIDVKQARA
jgi:hypothetical protein